MANRSNHRQSTALMEDSISVKSNDSAAVSDEFEIVGGGTVQQSSLPQLKIAGDGSLEGLWHSLGEMLNEEIDQPQGQGSVTPQQASSSGDEIEEICDVLQDCTIFDGVSFLGGLSINAPKSDTEIQRNISTMNEQVEVGIRVSISIPSCSDGCVVMYDGQTNSIMLKCEICRICYFAKGIPESNRSCFAFTWVHGDSIENSIYRCNVFRCDIPEAVDKVSSCFTKAFKTISKSMTTSVNGDLMSDPEIANNSGKMFLLQLTMEIKEDDGKGGYSTVPREKNCFKLRSNVGKQICLTISQMASETKETLEVKRCFGVLIAHGKNVKHSDMQLLDKVLIGTDKGDNGMSSVITGLWNPKGKASFSQLNTETLKDEQVYLTVAVDLVFGGIREPVRLVLETQVRVCSNISKERFFFFGRRSHIQTYFLNLKEVPSQDDGPNYEVVSIESTGPIDRNRLNMTLNNLANLIRSPSLTSIDTLTPKDEMYNSDGDEPMLSGTGEVSKDCSLDELESWSEVLSKWGATRPKQLSQLVKQGIPEALRGEVWQRLAKCDDNTLMDNYRILITQESNCEQVIQRDINRTFPAHDFFKENGGGGQDVLFRLSKAYAVHDTEVGYCQGLSFLAATLLLHMPEEQAFCVLLKVMYDYGLRELYKDGFECLYLRLYQLNRLMEEHVPQLYQHFREKGVESHMFASQWFLTLYTARFPLYFVFHIIDVFLLQGTETVFQVALALLKMCQKDLMQLDFECILKYFRVTLPKKCRNQEVSRSLMKMACNIKVKKLKKYEQEFLAIKEAQENADQYSNELDRMKSELLRNEEEKKRLEEQITQLKDMLKREVDKAENDNGKNSSIIQGYKEICQRLDREQQATKASLNQILFVIDGCERCGKMGKILNENPPNEKKDEGNNESQLLHRITELELDLARAKLAQVEAECTNQDLTHKLSAAVTELHAAKNSWPPWLSKTLTSIKEVAANKATAQRRESAPETVDSS
ncbi:rab GTPase-activating protein 1 [Cimex lectularius]|uniref:Rab-GAP TBC domain-containing protein n=1 Tax=Cimex lectularius TaxID=79782 RepID=A0A8I6RPC2_CIMLE|nr:rab GTPase-activating protein 1 [Cimex lectularius]